MMNPYNPRIQIYYRTSQNKASSSVIALRTLRKFAKKIQNPPRFTKRSDHVFMDEEYALRPVYEREQFFDIPRTRTILCTVFFHHMDFIDACMEKGFNFASFHVIDGRMIVTMMENRSYLV